MKLEMRTGPAASVAIAGVGAASTYQRALSKGRVDIGSEHSGCSPRARTAWRLRLAASNCLEALLLSHARPERHTDSMPVSVRGSRTEQGLVWRA